MRKIKKIHIDNYGTLRINNSKRCPLCNKRIDKFKMSWKTKYGNFIEEYIFYCIDPYSCGDSEHKLEIYNSGEIEVTVPASHHVYISSQGEATVTDLLDKQAPKFFVKTSIPTKLLIKYTSLVNYIKKYIQDFDLLS